MAAGVHQDGMGCAGSPAVDGRAIAGRGLVRDGRPVRGAAPARVLLRARRGPSRLKQAVRLPVGPLLLLLLPLLRLRLLAIDIPSQRLAQGNSWVQAELATTRSETICAKYLSNVSIEFGTQGIKRATDVAN